MKRFMSLILVVLMLVTASGCSKAGYGSATGAALGGAAGALVFKNKMLGAAIGGGAGLLVGYMIGNEFDKHDLAKAASVLENGRTGVPLQWTNEQSGQRVQAVPGTVYQNTKTGEVWRDLTLRTTTGDELHVRAFRNADGTWDLAQQQ